MIRIQTIIIGICVIITILLSISNLFIPVNKEDKTFFTKAKFYLLLVIILVVFPLALVHLYAVNCMLEGNCVIFTWVIVAITLILTIAYIVSFIYGLIKIKKLTSQEKLTS